MTFRPLFAAPPGRLPALLLLLVVVVVPGCHHWGPGLPAATDPPPFLMENPIFVPVTDEDFVWLQVVDAVDDYFRIAREDRVRVVGGVPTEGRLQTYPLVGSTLLEPWRRDSTRGYERLYSTLQSVRRRAVVRVVPLSGGHEIEVLVYRELEDVERPEMAAIGQIRTIRHDGSVDRTEERTGVEAARLGWIPVGRDISLEQRILADLRARLDVHPTELQRVPPTR